jgi:hypothetical protein
MVAGAPIMLRPSTSPVALLALAASLALVACDGGSSSGALVQPPPPGPQPIVPGPGWPELPAGAGAVEIDMEGTWEITSVAVVTWEPSPWMSLGDPLGQTLVIGPHAMAEKRVELIDFAWLEPVLSSFSNEGDGKFLLYSYFALPGSGSTIGGSSVNIAISIGSAGPDALVGHFIEVGRTSGFIAEFELDFEFTAERRP